MEKKNAKVKRKSATYVVLQQFSENYMPFKVHSSASWSGYPDIRSQWNLANWG